MNVNPRVISTSDAGKGQIVVTILGNSQFEVSTINMGTIRIGNASPDTQGSGEPKASLVDSNGDGILDLAVHFIRSELIASGALTPATKELVLQADLNDDRQIEARGSVNVKLHD
jgi:hypothetical protein